MGCNWNKRFSTILLSVLLLLTAGCKWQSPSQTAPSEYKVVTQIHVVYHRNPIVSEGYFSDPEKMQQILLYLRQISPYGRPSEDPEAMEGSDYYITLHYSDNSRKVYQQRSDRFMRINSGPWKRIDPKKAVTLSQILETMDSDIPDPNNTTPFFIPAE